MKGFITIFLCITRLTLTLAACLSPVNLEDVSAVEDSLALTTACNADSIVVSINPCVLEQMGYDLMADITVNGYSGFSSKSSCSVTPQYTPETSWTFTISEPLSECGTFFRTKANGNLVYKNAVFNIAHSNTDMSGIIRRREIYLPFECIYPNTFILSGSGGFDPEVPLLSGDIASGSGDFGVTIKLCEDIACSNEVTPGQTIEVLAQLYLVVTTSNSGVQIIINNVIASDVNGDNEQYLLQDGCLVENVYSAITNPGDDGGMTYLDFHAFYIAAAPDDNVYFTVNGELCEMSSGPCDNPCTVNTVGRRRRSLLPYAREPISATIGPFRTRVI